ncbi:hypothetical protein EKO23_03160 [Nocardioides guangzhouensis]|uniref:ABM domain-containing protein n=1 Tax=Nocardioides guangzhouensis TaxID=2497878 RepID=A0A4Q4ZJ66_9ACTN|nr:hypothetical protein [Nocardioides guangzhouensis]RYP88342.1 hypothetical protein EKO23_03160 [Nocardioides guangzhouensis]
MTGAVTARAADVVIYVDHSDILPDRLDELKEGIRRVVAVIEEREPQLIAYGFHLDEERGRMTVTAVHPDSASLELHLGVGREEFRKLGGMITLRRIEVYGSIDERVRDLLEQKVEMLGVGEVVVTPRLAGFARTTAAR